MNFNLDDKQKETASKWMSDQCEKKPAATGAIGGRFTFSFTATSLGTIEKVVDNVTKEELDLTDYGSF